MPENERAPSTRPRTIDGTDGADGADGAIPPSTKQRLRLAGERLFAREGIHRVRLREINELAGQRNPSALHYHFGSRDGLVNAILLAHQAAMDEALKPRLDEMESGATPNGIREIVQATVGPLAAELKSESGRDFLRIIPQVLDTVSLNVRGGAPPPGAGSIQPGRTLALLDRRIEHLPEGLRRERLVAYVLILTSLMAERAQLVESGVATSLDHEQFVTHVTDVLTSVLGGPSTVTPYPRPESEW